MAFVWIPGILKNAASPPILSQNIHTKSSKSHLRFCNVCFWMANLWYFNKMGNSEAAINNNLGNGSHHWKKQSLTFSDKCGPVIPNYDQICRVNITSNLIFACGVLISVSLHLRAEQRMLDPEMKMAPTRLLTSSNRTIFRPLLTSRNISHVELLIWLSWNGSMFDFDSR